MVKVILRDDDLSIYCDPKDLDIFFKASNEFDEVILSMVPFPSKQSKIGIKINEKLEIPKNNAFIIRAKELLQRDNVNLSMHGIRHFGYGEFQNKIKSSEIIRAKKTLEDIFEVKVDSFTPPNNILTKSNFYKIADAGFNRLFSAFSNWPSERPINYYYLNHFFRSSFLALKGEKARRIIKPLKFKNLEELPSFIAYNINELNELVENIVKSNININDKITIATHYWELWRTHPNELLKLPSRIKSEIN